MEEHVVKVTKAAFVYYSEYAENEFKKATMKTFKEAMKDGADQYAVIKIVSFASLDYGLKSELLSGAFRDLEAFKTVVEHLIDHLVTEDKDVKKAIKIYNDALQTKSKQ